jgi:hypothetical protein
MFRLVSIEPPTGCIKKYKEHKCTYSSSLYNFEDYTLRNTLEEAKPDLHGGGNLKSRRILFESPLWS